MSDYMIRGTAAQGQVRFFAASTKETAEFGRAAHELSPICAAALGRLLTAGAMMGFMMKGEKDLLTIKIDCDGPIQGLTVTADAFGHVKGYVKNPVVILPANDRGHLNVGEALGLGVLSVIRDVGLKDPYVGQTILETGEIAEDLTYYFATSEQTPSSVALGVLLDKETAQVKNAGGFIIQMMPGASDGVIDALEKKLSGFSSVTEYLESGKTVEDMMKDFFEGMDPEFLDRIPVAFTCSCSEEKTKDMLMSLPKEEIQSLIDEGREVEMVCQFCSKKYHFSPEDLQTILAQK